MTIEAVPARHYIPAHLQTLFLLAQLERSAFSIYPTGSRFFGVANGNSDYDFFTANTLDCEEFLQQLGFTPIANWAEKYYISDYQGLAKVYTSLYIDVQLVNNVEEKIAIQQAAFPVLQVSMDKAQARIVWDGLYRRYRGHLKDTFTVEKFRRPHFKGGLFEFIDAKPFGNGWESFNITMQLARLALSGFITQQRIDNILNSKGMAPEFKVTYEM